MRTIAPALLFLSALLIGREFTAHAQLYTVRPAGRLPGRLPAPQYDNKTAVSVELMMGDNAGALQAQDWSRVFEQLKVPVRIRRGLPGDKQGVSEQIVGTLRFVKAIGTLERSGEISFGRRRYSRADAEKLGEWLRELQAYGAQGSPKGQPLWGLSDTQFSELYEALAEPVENEIEGLSLTGAIALMRLPQRYPLRFSSAARQWLETEKSLPEKVRQQFKEFAKGTALAIVLNNFGLGFRPERTPQGGIELVAEPLGESGEFWRAGWEPKDTRPQTAPRLFELVPVELEDVPLVDVLDAISARTGLPIRYDDYRIARYEIDLQYLKVSYPSRRTSWSIVLRGLTNPAKLSHELRIDERGEPFIWISTLKIGDFGR
jgi:hypothetical protein